MILAKRPRSDAKQVSRLKTIDHYSLCIQRLSCIVPLQAHCAGPSYLPAKIWHTLAFIVFYTNKRVFHCSSDNTKQTMTNTKEKKRGYLLFCLWLNTVTPFINQRRKDKDPSSYLRSPLAKDFSFTQKKRKQIKRGDSHPWENNYTTKDNKNKTNKGYYYDHCLTLPTNWLKSLRW